MKPTLACVCAAVRRVENRTGVFVFQHPRERFHPIGTARLVRLGLAQARVETLWPGETETRPPHLPEGTALLYPSRDARDLSSLPASERPRALAVIDGTWHHARTLHRDTPWLRELPHVRLSPPAPSRYRIRREPRADYLSTLEAIVRALQVLEPDTGGLAGLLDAFDAMIDRQIELRADRQTLPRTRARSAMLRGLPHAITRHFERVVVVYGESSLMRYEGPRGRRELLQWAAYRPKTGETFERLLRPTLDLCRPWHLGHMGLTQQELARGTTVSEFVSDWRAFARPDDVLIAWNQGVLTLLTDVAPHGGQQLPLKSVYRTVHPSARGGIEDIVAAEKLAPHVLPVRGRAASRLGNAVSLVEALRRRVLDEAHAPPAPDDAPSRASVSST
jgi:DTW domain-containing protein YfiP